MKLLQKSLVVIIILAMTFTSLGTATVFSKGKPDTPKIVKHVTGLKAPTENETKEFKAKAKTVKKVLPNTKGLERINNARQEKGLDILPKTFSVSASNEIISKQNSKSAEKKYSSILNAYGDITSSLPSSIDNSTENYFPAIGDQGNIGSCASFATTYYAATYETAKTRNLNLKTDTDKVLSPRFTYNLENDGEDAGTSLYGNFLVMYYHGSPFTDETSMAGYQYNGYDYISGTTINPKQYLAYPSTAEIWRDGLKNRLLDMGTVDETNTTDGLTNIKSMLNNDHVLVFGTSYMYDWDTRRVSNDPGTAADDGFTGQLSAYGMNVEDPDYYSGHAMTIVGYDDNIWIDINSNSQVDSFEKGAFKVANSWGNDWGNQGYIWMAYDALQTAHGHEDVIDSDEMIYLTAQNDYTPTATADITITTARRNQLNLYAGANWSEAGQPMDVSYASDYVFSASWGGPYSFEGTSTPSNATVVLDLTDYIKKYDFDGAGGILSFCAGVQDETNDNFSQTVSTVEFNTTDNFQALDPTPVSINGDTKWFTGKHKLTAKESPVIDPNIQNLENMILDTPSSARSTGPDDAAEWRFSPAKTGTYIFTSGLEYGEGTLEIQNEARKTLYIDEYSGQMEVLLYAGKTYVLRTWYAGEGTGTTINANISLLSAWLDSSLSSKLGSLSFTTGEALVPAFDPATYSYRVNINEDAELSAAAVDTQAVVMIDGKQAETKTFSLGDNEAKVARVDVTARDWSSTSTYSILLTKGTPSANADLSSMNTSAGTLSPGVFDPGTLEYALNLPYDTGSVTINASKSDSNARLTINGKPADSITLKLNEGESRDVIFKLLAQNLVTEKAYSIHVERSISPQNADLGAIKASKGVLSPSFAADNLQYSLTLSSSTTSTTITPQKADKEASMLIDGEEITSKTITLGQGKSQDVAISVTSKSGTVNKVYTIHAVRQNKSTSITIAPTLLMPKDIVASPDSPVLYMTGNGQSSVYEVNCITGEIRQVSFPYTAEKLAVRNGKIYATLLKPASSSDAIGIIDAATFTIEGTIDVNMDVTGAAADAEYVYAYNSSTISAYSLASGAKISSISVSSLNSLQVNQANGGLYGAASNYIYSFRVAGGTITQVKSYSTGASKLYISPEGDHCLLSSGTILQCSATTSQDLTYLGKLPQYNTSACFNGDTGEIYSANAKVINICNKDTYAVKYALQQGLNYQNIFYTAGRLITATKNTDNSLTVKAISPTSMLRNLKIDGDAFVDFYPGIQTYDRGTVPYSEDYILIEAEPLYDGAGVSGDIGWLPLAVGKNTFTISVEGKEAATSETYTLTITRSASDPAPEPDRDARVCLGFTPYDTAFDNDSGILYMTAKNGYKLYAVDYSSGSIWEKEFPLPAEHLTLKNGKIYLTLLRQTHQYYTGDTPLKGSIAIVDTETWSVEHIFDVETDPYDIEADDAGYVFITPGSDQWEYLKAYDTGTQALTSSVGSVYYGNTLVLNPQLKRLYMNNLGISTFNINNGVLSSGPEYDPSAPYNSYNTISPDGTRLYSGTGSVFVCSESRTDDMTYIGNIGKSFTGICFDPDENQFFTASGKTLTAWTYDVPDMKYTLNSRNDIISIGYDGDCVIALEKTPGGDYFVDRFAPDSLLSGISINGTALQNFYALDADYGLALTTDATSVTVEAAAYTDGSTLSGDLGTVNLVPGDNLLTITVLGPSGWSRNYNFHVKRQYAWNADLSGINATYGTLSPSFSPTITDYNLTIDSNTASTTITPVKDNSASTIKIDGTTAASKTVSIAAGITQDVSIEITSADGTVKKTYTIHVKRLTSSNANLSNISCTSGTLSPAFSSTIQEFTLTLTPNNASTTITPVRQDISATYAIDGASVPSKTVSIQPGASQTVQITVTASDGVAQKIYSVLVKRQVSSNANLSSISASYGTLSPSFNSALYDYNLALSSATSSTTMTPTLADSTASIKIDGNTASNKYVSLSPGTSQNVVIVVTAQDGTTQKTYTVHVYRSATSNANLSTLTASAGTLDPVFNADTLAYNLTLSNTMTSTTITPTRSDMSAVLKIDGSAATSKTVTLGLGANQDVGIQITAADGVTQKQYTVHVVRLVSTNANLSGLGTPTGTLTPSFASATLEYELTLPAVTASTTLTPAVEDSTATFRIDGFVVASKTITLNPGGSQDVQIKVTAQDGVKIKTYIIHINRLSNDGPVISPYQCVPKDVVASPDGPVLYLTGSGQSTVYELNCDTGNYRTVTLPFTADKLALNGGKLYVSMVTSTSGSDAVGIINLETFALEHSFNTDMDISGVAADSTYIYAYNTNGKISVYDPVTYAKLSTASISSFNKLVVNSKNGMIYTANGTLYSYRCSAGQIQSVKNYYNNNYSSTSIYLSPDGSKMLLNNGVVLTSSAAASEDLQYLGRFPAVTSACWGANGETFLHSGRNISAANVSDFTAKYLIGEPINISSIYAGGGKVIILLKNADNTLSVHTAAPDSLLGAIRINGDAFCDFYPSIKQYNLGEVPNAVSNINIQGVPLDGDPAITGEGNHALVIGKNTFTLTVEGASGLQEKYTFTVYRRENDPPVQENDARVSLGFAPMDMAADPDRPIVYMTAVNGKSLFSVNYETGEIKEKKFRLPAETLTVENGKIYLTLLRQGHMYSSDNNIGSFAVIDTGTWAVERIFNVSTDPYDIEADATGHVYLAPGSDQWESMQVYDAQTGALISSAGLTRAWSYIDMAPQMNKLYSIDTDSSPRDIEGYEISNGVITNHYDSPYHGDYSMSTYMKVSPDGKFIFNGSGNVFTCSPVQSGDMLYAFNIGSSFTSIAFDLGNNLFATGSGKTINIYDYTTRQLKYTIPMKNDVADLQFNGGKFIVLEKKSDGTYKINTFTPDTLLTGVSINGTPLANFYATEPEYPQTIVTNATSVTVLATALVEGSTISGDTGITALNIGENILTLTVKGANTGLNRTYKIHVTRPDSNNADLARIDTSGGTLSPTFAPNTLNYTLTLPPTRSSVTITPVKSETYATFAIDGVVAGNKTITLNPGASQDVSIEVTAPDGTTKKAYTIRVIREASSNTNLTGINVTQGTLSPAFNSGTTEYTLTLSNTTTGTTITPYLADITATLRIDSVISVSKSLTMAPGEKRDVTVEVTAQDGTSKKTYTIHAVRLASANADLSNINVSTGQLTPSFSSSTSSYTLTLPTATTQATITPMLSDSTAAFTIDGQAVTSKNVYPVQGGSQDVNIAVTAQDGKTKKSYMIHAVRLASTNANLSGITLSAGALTPSFSADTLDYNVVLPVSTNTVTINPLRADIYATVKIDGVAVSNADVQIGINSTRAVTIQVTAQDPTISKQYTLHLSRPASADAFLSNIKMDGKTVSGFDKGTYVYYVGVPYATESVNIAASTEDPNATASGTGIKSLLPGDNEFNITVTAEDTSSKKTYRIVVRRMGNNADLSTIKIHGTALDGFGEDILTYSINVQYEEAAVAIDAIPADPKASVIGTGTRTLAVGNNIITLTAKSEDESVQKTYTLNIYRATEPEVKPYVDGKLSNILVNGSSVSTSFSWNVTNYTVMLDENTSSVVIVPVRFNNSNKMTIDGRTATSKTVTLTNPGNSAKVRIIVYQTSLIRTTYYVTVTRAKSTNTDLASLSASKGIFDPVTFSKDTTNYTLNLSNIQSSTSISFKTAGYKSSYSITLDNRRTSSRTVSLKPGETKTMIITVKSQYGNTKTYTIVFKRAISHNRDLASLSVSKSQLQPTFLPGTTYYTLNLASTQSSVTLYPVKADPTASYTITSNGRSSGSTISLSKGETKTVIITVISQAGEKNFYTIMITRQAY